ncbi:MAG: signal peptidase I [Candidatus Bathyarchaeales archaeon]
MSTEALKKLWKNEYFQTAVTIAIIFMIVFGFYFGSQIILGTEYPALAVASGSMLPTLNIGDLIIVQKVDPAKITADKFTGDVLVFRDPRNPSELIVHRAVKIENKGSYFLITTLGDNMYGEKDQFSPWNSSLLIGKVVARVPYVGNLPLFFHSERNMYVFLMVILIIIAILMLPFGFNGEEKSDEEKLNKEKKLFWKLDLSLIYFFAMNILIIALLIFSLWGSFTFWQPGASPPQATIFGMYADLNFHERFSSKAYLSYGFMTYRIDCQVNNGTRLGIPTFAWFQLLILILILYDAWKITNFVKTRKTKEKS